MAQSALLALRLDAARACVACQSNAEDARQAHARSASNALQASLPDDLAGVLPRYDPRAPARLAGALRAALIGRTLMQSHDEDWFDNPRAHEQVSSVDVTMRVTLTQDEVRTGAVLLRGQLADVIG